MKEQLKGLKKTMEMWIYYLIDYRMLEHGRMLQTKNWVENSDYWVQLTKSIEDKLSDKLHDELTKSFIDKKISMLSRGLKQDLVLNTEINDENKIHIDGQRR